MEGSNPNIRLIPLDPSIPEGLKASLCAEGLTTGRKAKHLLVDPTKIDRDDSGMNRAAVRVFSRIRFFSWEDGGMAA